MANNYILGSMGFSFPPEKKAIVDQCVDEACSQLEEKDEFIGFEYSIEESKAYFSHGESLNVEQLEYLLKHVVETAKLEYPIYFSWAEICDKPRIDEFGGGACIIKLGQPTKWFSTWRWLHNEE